MTTKLLTIESRADGLPLSVLLALPEGEPRALVQFSHGMAEHKERYLPLMERLANAGYACMINDHRGHGASVRSNADLGYFYNHGDTALVDDLHQLTEYFRAMFPGKKLTLVGHSMGSFAARAYAAKYGSDIDALVLSGSPGYNAAAPVALALIAVVRLFKGDHAKSGFLDSLLNGSFAKNFPGDSKFLWLSANRENVARYDADPLCGFPFTVNGYRSLVKLMRAAYDKRTRIREDLPVLFLSGADDPCAPNHAGFEAAIQNLKDRGCKNVSGKMYSGLRHEIFNETAEEPKNALMNFIAE